MADVDPNCINGVPGADSPEQREAAPVAEPKVDVGKAARQGGVWAIVTYGFTKVSGFASSIILARVLMPEHFGLIGMTNTVLGLVQMLGNCGIGFALMHQRDDVDEYANTTWWLDLSAGVLLFIVANACSPIAAHYYHEPRVRALIFVASFNFIIGPIGGTMGLLLTRDLRFKESAQIGLIGGFATSILTIILGLMGAGVWSFVYPTLIAGALTTVLRWRAYPWRPKIRVKWRLAGKLLNFGKNIVGSSILEYVNQNVDYILVGAMLGKAQLGLYVFAYNLGLWIVQNVSGTIASVAFPTFASVQDDPDRARNMFLKLIKVIALAGFPIVCIQWATAPLYVGAIYGGKWLPAVTAFRLIALYGVGRAVCSPGGTLISALGRPDINLKISAAVSPILIAAIYIGSRHGINGVATATAAAHGLFVWFYIIIPFRILKWNSMEAARALAPALVSSVLAAVITGHLWTAMGSPTRSLGALFALVGIGGACYIGSLFLLFRRAALEAIDLVKTTVRESRGRANA